VGNTPAAEFNGTADPTVFTLAEKDIFFTTNTL
jgi:hypothetical protein